jgi:hypothetical protein
VQPISTEYISEVAKQIVVQRSRKADQQSTAISNQGLPDNRYKIYMQKYGYLLYYEDLEAIFDHPDQVELSKCCH